MLRMPPVVRVSRVADCKTDVSLTEYAVLHRSLLRADKLPCDRRLYVEIGVFRGGTFIKVLEHLHFSRTKPQWQAVGVDFFENFRPSDDNTHVSGSVDRNSLSTLLIEQGYNNFILLRGDSEQLLRSLKQRNVKTSGVAFIDANHTYHGCKRDAIAAYDLFDSGIFVFHNASVQESRDYPKTHGGPWRVCQELMKEPFNMLHIESAERMTALEKAERV